MSSDRFPQERILTACLVVGIAAIGVAGLLLVLDLPRQLEDTAFFVSFAGLFAAGLLYSALSIRKAWWLLRSWRKNDDRKS